MAIEQLAVMPLSDYQAACNAVREKGGSQSEEIKSGELAEAITNIPSGEILIEKTITENGVYNAEDDGANGYSKVTVNVGGEDTFKYYIQTIRGDCSSLFSEKRSLTNEGAALLIKYDTTTGIKNFSSMFYSCYNLSEVPLFDTSEATNLSIMFADTKIETVPLFDFRKATNWYGLFRGCSKLKIIPALDCISATSLDDLVTRGGGGAVEEIHLLNIGANLNLTPCTKLTREAIIEVLNNLQTVTSTKTLTLGSTNLAKLTDEDKAIATNKGWTLA